MRSFIGVPMRTRKFPDGKVSFGDCRVAFEQWFVLHYGLIDGKCGTNVLHNRTNVYGNGWRSWHLTPNYGINQLLFTPCGYF